MYIRVLNGIALWRVDQREALSGEALSAGWIALHLAAVVQPTRFPSDEAIRSLVGGER